MYKPLSLVLFLDIVIYCLPLIQGQMLAGGYEDLCFRAAHRVLTASYTSTRVLCTSHCLWVTSNGGIRFMPGSQGFVHNFFFPSLWSRGDPGLDNDTQEPTLFYQIDRWLMYYIFQLVLKKICKSKQTTANEKKKN